jgi:hypothetical protein
LLVRGAAAALTTRRCLPEALLDREVVGGTDWLHVIVNGIEQEAQGLHHLGQIGFDADVVLQNCHGSPKRACTGWPRRTGGKPPWPRPFTCRYNSRNNLKHP